MSICRGQNWFARVAVIAVLSVPLTIGSTWAQAFAGTQTGVKTITLTMPTVLPAVTASAGGSPCQGSNTVTWTGGGPASYFGHDVLQLGCVPTIGIAGFFIQCQSFIFYNGQQITPSSSQSAGTDSCQYTTTTNFALLILSRVTYQANFSITIISQPGYDEVWGPNSNICSGGGTPTATCQDGPTGDNVPFAAVSTYQ